MRSSASGFQQQGGTKSKRYGYQNRDGSSISITVPTNKISKLIGRGGSKITELEKESKTKISITDKQDNFGTIVKIFGDEGPTSKAKLLIEQLVLDPPVIPPPVECSPMPTNLEKVNLKELSEEYDRNHELKWAQFPKLLKDFYVEDPEISVMSPKEVETFRMKNNNTVVGRVYNDRKDIIEIEQKPIPKPVKNFEQAFHPWPEIVKELRKAGFKTPSPIQAQAWPALLGGEDVIGIAQTGTGKTLAFLLPALVHIENQPIPRNERRGPNVLIMAPTRELALQIQREVDKYSYREIKTVCLYGGGSRREQIRIISTGVQIIIATPGRLNDLVSAGYIDISSVTYLVLDEADKMLDMGFEPQIRKTLFDIRPDRQTVMTSATWPLGVRRLAQSYMRNPIQIYVGTLDLTTANTVKQELVFIDDDDEDKKFDYFINWIKSMKFKDKIIIFCSKKARVDHISSELVSIGLECHALHGDRDQSDREQAVQDIISGAVQILVATDVASRGLDIQDLTHVFNYDFPLNISEYVHRVGRTGRAGRTGTAVSIFTSSDWSHAKDLIRILKESDQDIPPELTRISQKYTGRKHKRDI